MKRTDIKGIERYNNIRDEPIFLNSSWNCNIPNFFFLLFTLLSFSFRISDSTDNGNIAEVLLGNGDVSYQNRSPYVFCLPCSFIIISFA